jgi:hypothetical protein
MMIKMNVPIWLLNMLCFLAGWGMADMIIDICRYIRGKNDNT